MIIETQYLPPIDTFVLGAKTGNIRIEKHEHYQKKSYRNRCHILGANGLIRLSIPLLKGKNQGMPIDQVEIDYTVNWPKQHIQSIRSAYGSSAYYEFYSEELYELIESRNQYLYEFNMNIFKFLAKQLNIDILETDRYKKEYPSDDFRSKIKPNKTILDNQTVYEQIFSSTMPFHGGLSIIDTLFAKGPELKSYITQQSIRA